MMMSPRDRSTPASGASPAWRARLLAAVVDVVFLVTIYQGLAAWFPEGFVPWPDGYGLGPGGEEPRIVVEFVGLVVLVQWALIAWQGRSLGKWLAGLRVVGRDGQRAGFFRAGVLRPWFKVILAIFVLRGSWTYWNVVSGRAEAVPTRDLRSAHDRAAGTRLVSTRS